MKKVYDIFADEYIDESEINPIAPPERYTEITEDILVENAARWFLTELKKLLDVDLKDENSSEKPNNCETCKHKYDGMGYCKTCGESNYEPKDEPTKYRIVHSILQGQSGNEGVEYEILDGFTTYKEAQEQIATMPHNGWHNYKIEEVNESN